MTEQGTEEWHAMRCGKVTSSRIADIMRSGRGGKPSASRARYMGELATERLTGVQAESFKSADMQWGNDTEEEAANAYAFLNSVSLDVIAFIDHPKIAMSGCSPDRLIGRDGLLEIKCPASHTHIGSLLCDTIDGDYIRQMQWQMACTGRAWCDFLSYDPRMPEEMRLYTKRIHRDTSAIADMEEAVLDFLAELDQMVSDLQRRYAQSAAA